MTETTNDATRDRWVDTGIWAVGIIAAVLSWAGWVGLARLCGWADSWSIAGAATVQLAWLLPLAVDVYALIGFRVWLRVSWASETTHTFAARSTLTAIGLGIGGNAGYHLMVSLGWTRAPWVVVVLVSALPPIMLGAVAHLAALTNRDRLAAGAKPQVTPAETTPAPEVETPARPVVETPAERPAVKAETPAVKPKPAPVKTPAPRVVAPVQSSDEDHLETIRAAYPAWRTETVSLGQIKTATGIRGQATAVRLKKALYPDVDTSSGTPADDRGDDQEQSRDLVLVGAGGH